VTKEKTKDTIEMRCGEKGGKSIEGAKSTMATTKSNHDSSYVPYKFCCDFCGSQKLKRDFDGTVTCKECGAVVNGNQVIKQPTTKKVGQARLDL
jgi:ribosomal protein L37AE/L43A